MTKHASPGGSQPFDHASYLETASAPERDTTQQNATSAKARHSADQRDTSDSAASADTAEAIDRIHEGMVVETSDDELGEQDVSEATVTAVTHDDEGRVSSFEVEKGLVFRKHIEVPAERVVAVQAPNSAEVAAPDGETASTTESTTETAETAAQLSPDPTPDAAAAPPVGTVVIATAAGELDALTAAKTEALPPTPPPDASDPSAGASAHGKAQAEETTPDLLGAVQQEVPTAEGLASLEARRTLDPASPVPMDPARSTASAASERSLLRRLLGPGLLAGMAGNDSSAITSYAVNGAVNGYGQLWLMLLSTPLLHATMFACAKIGRVTQQGFAELLKDHYGRRVALPAALILIVANIGLIASDLAAIGSGLELITGINWVWFVVPVALFLWYITLYQNFNTIKRVFLGMSLAFVAYLITGVFSGAHWGEVLRATFVPQVGFDFASISTAVALLGATVSPYIIYWQVQGEKEEQRPGAQKEQIRDAALDTGVGALGGNLVAYFVIVCTGATLFTHHQQVKTAADAAAALAPLVGPYAKYLFAIGFIGAGLVAIPVLLASTSYAVSGAFGWPASLWRKPWQNEGFYLILTVALVVSLVLALLRFDPIQLMFWANVLQGVLTPVLIIFLLLVGNNRQIMKEQRLGKLANGGLGLIAFIMIVAAILLFYGLATGQSS